MKREDVVLSNERKSIRNYLVPAYGIRPLPSKGMATRETLAYEKFSTTPPFNEEETKK